MRKPKLPASSNLQYLRANHSFNGGACDRPTFAERVFGDLIVKQESTPRAPPCFSSTRGMRSHGPIPASRQRKSQPRPVHRDATGGASQPSMIISPGTAGLSYLARHSAGGECWKLAQTRPGKRAESLRGAQEQTQEFVRKSLMLSLNRREHLVQHVPESHRRLQNMFVRSLPGAPRSFSTNNSPVRTPQAEAGPPASGSSKHRSKTMVDEDIISHKQQRDPGVRSRKGRKYKDDEIRALLAKVQRTGIITRTNYSKATHCRGDAVIIFLSRGEADDGSDSHVFKSTLARFSEHQVVEMKIPRAPNTWVPPRLDSIHLKGEEEGAVPIFDSCDEIRAKIEAYLSQPNSPNRHRFCRAVYAQLKGTKSKVISVTQLRQFRAGEGPSAGARSIMYYAAYVYFEKLRIAEGRPKSLHRLEMERRYPLGLKRKRRWNISPRAPN